MEFLVYGFGCCAAVHCHHRSCWYCVCRFTSYLTSIRVLSVRPFLGYLDRFSLPSSTATEQSLHTGLHTGLGCIWLVNCSGCFCIGRRQVVRPRVRCSDARRISGATFQSRRDRGLVCIPTLRLVESSWARCRGNDQQGYHGL